MTPNLQVQCHRHRGLGRDLKLLLTQLNLILSQLAPLKLVAVARYHDECRVVPPII